MLAPKRVTILLKNSLGERGNNQQYCYFLRMFHKRTTFAADFQQKEFPLLPLNPNNH
jgi:hypothetical protein